MDRSAIRDFLLGPFADADADYWRQIGVDVSETIPSTAEGRDPEYGSTFPGVDLTGRGSSDTVFDPLDGRLQAVAENRWAGTNRGHYSNPGLDQLIDRLYASIDERSQGQVLAEMGQLMATDLPLVPLFFRSAYLAVRSDVHALTNDYAETRWTGSVARNAHLWSRD